MTPRTIRHMLLALALLLGLAMTGTACVVHSDHDDGPYDIVVSVHNEHGSMIWVEGVDGFGITTDLGYVRDGEVVDFVLSDYWEGRELIARCESDGSIVDTTWAWDGKHWDVE